MHRFWISDG